MKTFDLTEIQADAILNMRLRQLRKLEEIEIRREHDDLLKEHNVLKALLEDKKRRWKAIAGEIVEMRKNFGKRTELGRRRTDIGTPPTAMIVPLEAMIEKEPVTVIHSDKGWIRTARGHVDNASSMKFKEGDRLRFAMHAETTDKLVIFGTNGRFYTLSIDKLPGGRGHGEPVRLMIDLPNGDDVVDMFILQGGRKFIVASDAGRGFIVKENDVVAQTKNGKQVLNLKTGQEAVTLAVIGEGNDHIAVLGTNRKLLIFSLDELPVMGRGGGVIMQRYAQGGLADVTTLNLKKGLTWQTRTGVRGESNIKTWVGKRGQAGQLPFKGFPKVNRFK